MTSDRSKGGENDVERFVVSWVVCYTHSRLLRIPGLYLNARNTGSLVRFIGGNLYLFVRYRYHANSILSALIGPRRTVRDLISSTPLPPYLTAYRFLRDNRMYARKRKHQSMLNIRNPVNRWFRFVGFVYEIYIYTYMSCYIWRKNICYIYIVDKRNDAIFVYLAEHVPSYKRRKMAKCNRIIVRTERPSELKNDIAKNIVGNWIN